MARAPALQAGGRGFDSLILHAVPLGSGGRFFDIMGGKRPGLRESAAGRKKEDTYTQTRRRAWEARTWMHALHTDGVIALSHMDGMYGMCGPCGRRRGDERRDSQSGGRATRPGWGHGRGRDPAPQAREGARGMPVAPGGDEGRGRPRKAAGRREQPEIRGRPNGATRHARAWHPPVGGGEPGEPKHPSSRRRGKQE